MKYISFVVPCYNSSEYMRKCIDSLIIGGEDIEILIIDDGSYDDTGKIADSYVKKYPKIVKKIYQKNGGHGEGINTGIKYARGKYFKVIDSDDWVGEEELCKVLKIVKKVNSDAIVMNYVYTYSDGRKDKTINFSNVFPTDREFCWDEIGKFKMTQYLSMHSLMFKRSVLKRAHIKLPKHTFYEDNLFIYLPLPYVKTLYYLDLDFYRYFIGRSDQSVQESQLIKKSSHQVLVSKEVCSAYDLRSIENKKLRKLMKRECVFLITLGVVFSRLNPSSLGEKQYKDLWNNIKINNYSLYKNVRYCSMASLVSIPGRFGRLISIIGYRFAHRLVNFN